MGPEERRQFAKKVMSPLESIAKHLTDHSAIEDSKLIENENSEASNLPLTRYHELNLNNDKDEMDEGLELQNDSKVYPDDNEDGNEDSAEENAAVPSNHKFNADEDSASTGKYETDEQEVTTSDDCVDCDSTMVNNFGMKIVNGSKSAGLLKDVDTIEGFQRFNDDLLSSE